MFINFKKNKKGFSLVELIAVMLIMGILVLLATPKFTGQVQLAQKTEITNSIRILESAFTFYQIKNDKYPLSRSYGKEEILTFGTKFIDVDGNEIELDDGVFYEFDYSELRDYMKIPVDKDKYIIKHPEGQILYISEITFTGEAILYK